MLICSLIAEFLLTVLENASLSTSVYHHVKVFPTFESVIWSFVKLVLSKSDGRCV